MKEKTLKNAHAAFIGEAKAYFRLLTYAEKAEEEGIPQIAWDRLDVGGVIIGDVPSWRADQMPYGGVKDSGLGREGIKYAMEDMTEMRLMVIRDLST